MLGNKQQRFDILSFPPKRPQCSLIISGNHQHSINYGKIKPKYISYTNADILIRQHNMKLDLNQEKQNLTKIGNTEYRHSYAHKSHIS